MSRPRALLRLALGIAVSLGCLWFATRGTDWAGVGAALASARPGWVVASMLAGVGTLFIRAQRWCILLRPLGKVGVYPAFSATAIGFGASAVLPFRIGELVRPAVLGRNAGVGMSAALSSVVIERLFDMLLVTGCFLGLALLNDQFPPALRRGAGGLAVLAVVGFVVLLVLQRRRGQAERLAGWLAQRLPARLGEGLRGLVGSFLHGLDALADGRTVALVLFYSVYLWAVIALTFGLALVALDIQVPLAQASLAVVVLVAACVFLPQAPGFVGTWQLGCVLALDAFGVPQEQAVGYSLLTWVSSMVVNITMASIFLAREDFSVGQLLRLTERDAPPAGAKG